MKDKTTEEIPRPFMELFGRLARRTQTPRMFDARSLPAYYSALSNVPIDTLEQSAEAWARSHVFFPTVAEWIETAIMLTTPDGGRLPLQIVCTRCGNRGLIAVRYESGEAPDVAICDCVTGQKFRAVGEAVVRHRLHLGPENRVAYVEDFAGEA